VNGRSSFLLRDAMLVRCMLSSCVCHKPVLYRNDWTNRAGFGVGASLDLSNIHVPLKIRVLPSGTISQTLDLENFATTRR